MITITCWILWIPVASALASVTVPGMRTGLNAIRLTAIALFQVVPASEPET